jgi:hypothetical protein
MVDLSIAMGQFTRGYTIPHLVFFQVPGGQICPSCPSSQADADAARYDGEYLGTMEEVPQYLAQDHLLLPSLGINAEGMGNDGMGMDGNGSPRAALLSHHIPPYLASGMTDRPWQVMVSPMDSLSTS